MTKKLFVTMGADGKLVVTHARPDSELDADDPVQAYAALVAHDYRKRWGVTQTLDWFQGQNEFLYLFDSTPESATDLTRPANRVIAAWGTSNPTNRVGDRRMLRRFPLPLHVGRSLDRGHLVALASGGGENVNLVPQASRLNRGWSDAGRRWRALERTCARNPGALLFVAVFYDDLSDIPLAFEFRVQVPGLIERVERFVNRD